MGWLWRLIDPFEVLYIAVAIATFEHTAWAAAYLFQGALPEGGDQALWFGRGALIAVAVDVGMFVTSRFIRDSRNRREQAVLVLSFFIAALVSFYAQVVFIAVHTPTVTISDGIAEYWRPFLKALIDARVLLLPLSLPVLATIFTLARLTHHRVEEARDRLVQPPRQRVERSLVEPEERPALPATASTADVDALYELLKGAPREEELVEGAEVIEVQGAWLDLRTREWMDTTTDRHYGPYKDRRNLRASVYAKKQSRSS